MQSSKRKLTIAIMGMSIAVTVLLTRQDLLVRSLVNQAVSFFTQTVYPWVYTIISARSTIPVFGAIALLGLIVWILNQVGALLQIKEWFTKRAEKEREVTEKFCLFFESIKDELNKCKNRSFPEKPPFDSKLLVAQDCDAICEQMDAAQKAIAHHLQSSKQSFHIFDICGGSKQGKSTFLWRLAAEVSRNQETKEYWCLKKGFRFDSREKWVEFMKPLQDYFNIRQKSVIVLFWDDPLESIAPELRPALGIHEIYDLWNELQRDLTKYLKRKTKVIVVATSSRPYPYRKSDWSSIASPEEDKSEDLKIGYVTPFPLFLTKNNAQSILIEYSKLKRVPDEKLQDFLRQLGIYQKCRGNVLFLLYLFEQFINPRELRFILDDDTRRNLESYDCWDESDNRKNIVRFVALANLLNLTVPKIILESVNVSDLDALRPNFLANFLGDWTLAVPFSGYVLLKEEITVAQDFSAYLVNILDPWVESTVSSLAGTSMDYSIHQSLFIRNIIHFIDEEQYRPILSKPGHQVAKRLFTKHRARLLSFIDEKLLPEVDKNPSLLWVIPKWASTFRRLGLWDRAEDLYEQTLQMLPRISGKHRVKVMIPLAEGLASLPQHKHRNKAIEIYEELLGGSRRTAKWLSRPRLLVSALNLFLQLKRADKALSLMDQLKIDWAGNPVLCTKRGQILENMGELPEAESCLRRAKELSEGPLISPETKINSLHRYALFLIRHGHRLPPDKGRPSIGMLLHVLQDTAVRAQQHVEAVHSARAKFYEKTKHDYKGALAEYRKGVDWCKDKGIPNPRPYNVLANYLVHKATVLPGLTSRYLVEAETCLKAVVNEENFDTISKKHSHSILGRLVGGSIRSEVTLKAIPYEYQGRARPDYDEALRYLRDSFESEDEYEHSDPIRKTWHDARTHSVVGDILRHRAHSENDVARKQQYLKTAKRHMKVAYESMPREDLDGIDVRTHIINAMDNYAHITWEIAKTRYSREVDTCWRQAIQKMEKWGLDRKSFANAYDLYKDYGYFSWKTKVGMHYEGLTVPHIPLSSRISDANGKDEVKNVVACYRKALLVLSEERPDYGKEYMKTGQRLLAALRALVADAIHFESPTEAVEWMEKYLEASQKLLDKRDKYEPHWLYAASKNVCDFLEHKKTRELTYSNPLLSKKVQTVRRLCQTS